MVKFYFHFFIIIQHQKGNELKSNKHKIEPQQQLRLLNSLSFSLVEQAESEKKSRFTWGEKEKRLTHPHLLCH